MYLYFNDKGILKEIINDKPLRQGEQGNDIFIYIEDVSDYTGIIISFQFANSTHNPFGSVVLDKSQYVKSNKTIPYDNKRDLKFFKYGKKYTFLQIPTSWTVEGDPFNALEEPGTVKLTVSLTGLININKLGLIVFNVEETTAGTMEIQAREWIDIAQWNYLQTLINNALESTNTNINNLVLVINTETITPSMASNYSVGQLLLNKYDNKLYIIVENDDNSKSAESFGLVLPDYQEKLISGTNIKTINGESILGSGNIVISGGTGGNVFDDIYVNQILSQNTDVSIELEPDDDSIRLRGYTVIEGDLDVEDSVYLNADVNFGGFINLNPSDYGMYFPNTTGWTENHQIATDIDITNVREVAEGKCRSFVISYSQGDLTESYFTNGGTVTTVDGEVISTWSDFLTFMNYGGIACGNHLFNSQDNKIILAQEYILTIDKIIIPSGLEKNGEPIKGIKTGDVIIVIETDVPDRWVSPDLIDRDYYKLETTKVDLTGFVDLSSDQTITGTKTIQDATLKIGYTLTNPGTADVKSFNISEDQYQQLTIGRTLQNDSSQTLWKFNGYKILPNGDGNNSIGANNNSLNELYTNNLGCTSNMVIKTGVGNRYYIDSNCIRPIANNEKTLGNSSTRWATVYTTNISDGTNTITVADLVFPSVVNIAVENDNTVCNLNQYVGKVVKITNTETSNFYKDFFIGDSKYVAISETVLGNTTCSLGSWDLPNIENANLQIVNLNEDVIVVFDLTSPIIKVAICTKTD